MNTGLPKVSEITEEQDDEAVNVEVMKERIRKIITHQRSLYASSLSSSSFSSAASTSTTSVSSKNSSLFELMKGGGTTLRRLFDMEHTPFEVYSESPVVKPICLWGSDVEEETPMSWASVKAFKASEEDDGVGYTKRAQKQQRRLKRKRSFRRLPGFGIWMCKGFRVRLRLRRLRVLICGRKF
ncbi:hypothetical protein QJS04_geneDACA011455 [Acorus gramineus]|uniref:Uncharacterized protein n=1 Tax=Acorus gramineus TaxID=55184 RepID=A0AAV9AKH0_ACOGR|nr:hypothetical protein QJS04_geneDACA011455 [Acorus gramineus]